MVVKKKKKDLYILKDEDGIAVWIGDKEDLKVLVKNYKVELDRIVTTSVAYRDGDDTVEEIIRNYIYRIKRGEEKDG